MSDATREEEPTKTTTGTPMYNLKRDLDDGSVKDGDYAGLLLERMNNAITLLDRQEEGIDSVKVRGREMHASTNAIKLSCHQGRAKIRSLKLKVDPNENKKTWMVNTNRELGCIVYTHSKTIAEHTRHLIGSLEEHLGRAKMVLNRCDIAVEVTKNVKSSVDHLEELLDKTTLDGPLGATAMEYDIL